MNYRSPFVLISLAGTASLLAGKPDQAPIRWAEILGVISDGTPRAPATGPELPEFAVKSTVVRRVEVVEAPPMPGLPPVRGTITETVCLVEDPKLPEPPARLPAVDVDDPAVLARLAEMSARYRKTEILFLSATVYDHSRTLLRCYPNGNPRKEIAVWSNLDFNHFSGFGTFEVKEDDDVVRRYALLMGIGNEDTQKRAAFLAGHGRKYVPPVIPELPELADDGPAFVILDAAPDAAGARLVEDMHELYRHEGGRMKAAYLARVAAEKARRAYLLAHPPAPADVTVNFWQREHPEGMPAGTIKIGGGR